jgi:hypothetical protein
MVFSKKIFSQVTDQIIYLEVILKKQKWDGLKMKSKGREISIQFVNKLVSGMHNEGSVC